LSIPADAAARKFLDDGDGGALGPVMGEVDSESEG